LATRLTTLTFQATPQPPARLTEEAFTRGLMELTGRDPDLAGIVQRLGPPPTWFREPGFPTLVHIILEQQVSLASAQAAFDRLRVAVSPLSPGPFLELDDPTLKAIGFSRQKTAYCRQLAASILEGSLELNALEQMEDETVRSALLQVKGIGPWTVDIYLLMALRRPDVWPSGDLALAKAVQSAKRLAYRPTAEQMSELAQDWQPWRGIAARILWHDYLNP
jgi:DNA-3-methyladenine glycosylase II